MQSGVGVAIAVGSGLGWAGFDLARKALAGRIPAVPLTALVLALQIPVFLGWLAISAATEGAGGGFSLDVGGYAVPGLAGVLCNTGANLLLVIALTTAPLSVSVPILSLSPVFTALFGWLFLGEALAPRQWAGVIAVVVGAVMLHATPAQMLRPWRIPAVWASERGSVLMIIVAALFGAVVALDKWALQAANVPTHAVVQIVAASTVMALIAWARGELGTMREAPRMAGVLLGSTVAAVAALGLQLVATGFIFVSSIEAIKRVVGLVASVVNGRVFFGEPVQARKLASIAVMMAGVALLLL